MASMNKVLILGNLGKDPEIRVTGGGQSVATLSVATSERWTDRDGVKQEKTEWHKVVVWGKQAEFCGQYLTKGSTVFVEGRIETRSWEDQEGNKRYSTEINASNVQAVGPKQTGSESGHSSRDDITNPDAFTPRGAYDTPAVGAGNPNAIPDDDVPF